MSPEEGAAFYVEALTVRHYSERTLVLLRQFLRWFCEWMEAQAIDDLRDVSLQTLLDYHTFLRKRRKPNGELSSVTYQNHQLWHVAAMLRLLHKRGKLLVDPSRHMPRLSRGRRLSRRVLTGLQVNRLLAVPDLKTLWGFRDRTMLELLYSSGLRGIELCQLTIHDLDWREKTVRIVQGKGRKDRLVPMGTVAMAYLREYLDRVRPALLNNFKPKPGYAPRESVINRLFFSRFRWPLTGFNLLRVVKRHAKIARLPEKLISTHGLRHACATEMLKGGASVRHVQEMLGHADLSTTQIYTQVLPYDLKKVHARTAPSERRRNIQVSPFVMKGWRDGKNRSRPK